MTLQVKRLTATAKLPTRAHEYDAGLDLYADENVTISPHGGHSLVRTGVAVAIDPGKVGFIWPRSGLDSKEGITTGAGVVDAGYRGGVAVLLRNHSAYSFGVQRGDKIAQLVIVPVCPDHVVEVDSLDSSDRGAQGFGSSGR
jgi:dUTP pyrophosphatase